jgi:hypothetical protein
MIVETKEGTLRISWNHYPTEKFPSISTVCTISYLEDIPFDPPFEGATGIAMTSKKDNYNYNKGRKLSLERALQFLYPNTIEEYKEKRKFIWEKYFEMRHEKY